MRKLNKSQDGIVYILPSEPFKNVVNSIINKVLNRYGVVLTHEYLKSKVYNDLLDLIVGKVFTDIILETPSNPQLDNYYNEDYAYYICRLLLTIDSTLLDKVILWDGEYFKLYNVILDDIVTELDSDSYLNSIIIPEFKERYAEWDVKITGLNIIVKYLGDYRIRRYHELHGYGYV